MDKFCSFDYSDSNGERSHRNVYLLGVDYQDDGKVPPHLSILAYDFGKNHIRRFKALNCFNFKAANMEEVCEVARNNMVEQKDFVSGNILYKRDDQYKVATSLSMNLMINVQSKAIEIIGIF